MAVPTPRCCISGSTATGPRCQCGSGGSRCDHSRTWANIRGTVPTGPQRAAPSAFLTELAGRSQAAPWRTLLATSLREKHPGSGHVHILRLAQGRKIVQAHAHGARFRVCRRCERSLGYRACRAPPAAPRWPIHLDAILELQSLDFPSLDILCVENRGALWPPTRTPTSNHQLFVAQPILRSTQDTKSDESAHL